MSSAAFVPSAACAAASAGEAPPARAASAALDGAADDGPVDRALGELLERPGPGRGRPGHPDLGEQFVGLERGLEQALEELPDGDLPGAVGAARYQGRL